VPSDRNRLAAELDSAGPSGTVDLKKRHRGIVTYADSGCWSALTWRKGGMLIR
jgi:hypothetical protein